MKTPCFNVIYEDENITIPEIDDIDFLNFSMVFMKIQEREAVKSKGKDLKIINF